MELHFPHTSKAAASLPLRWATPSQAIARYVRNYFKISGRASRSEFWWATAASLTVSAALEAPYLVRRVKEQNKRAEQRREAKAPRGSEAHDDGSARTLPALSPPAKVFAGLTLIGMSTLQIRRLHDTNKSGWFAMIGLVPLAGPLVQVILCSLRPRPEGRRFD